MNEASEYERDLDLASFDVDFDEMENDIKHFADEPSVREVLEVGVDLQNYSSEIAKQLKIVEAGSIGDYLNHVDTANVLHQEIADCYRSLEEIEQILFDFKDSMGQLSSDICSLQARSEAITTKLANRKNLEESLGEFARNVSFSRAFAKQICSGQIGPDYIQYTDELDRKLQFIHLKENKSSAALQEIRIPLDRLRMKASENIYYWLIKQLNELRDHYGTEQVIIQTTLLQCKPLYRFLKNNSPDIEQTIREYYINIMSRIYLENFKALCRRIRQMNPISLSQETIIPITQKSYLFYTKRTINESAQFFTLGEREKLLNEILSPPSSFGNESYPVEAYLRSLYQILIDAATAEHIFASDFFYDEDITSSIFLLTTNFLESYLTDLFKKITDPVSFILLLRFSYAHRTELANRPLSKIDNHIGKIQKIMIERFKEIIKENKIAIDSADPKLFLENPTTAHHANSMTKRFAEFAASLSKLLNEDVKGLIIPELDKIASSSMELLAKIAQEFTTEEMQDVFLINNYFSIVSTLKQAPQTTVLEMFDQLLTTKSSDFMDFVIQNEFPDLAKIVRDAYPVLESRENPNITVTDERIFKEIIADFKDRHVTKLKNISENQITRFGDFLYGKNMLTLIAKRLVLYWAKFSDLAQKTFKSGAPWLSSMLTIQQVVSNLQPIYEFV